MTKRNWVLAVLLVGLAILLNCDVAFSQISRTNALTRPCAGSSTKARVEILRTGNIDLVPCSGKDILLNGSALSNGFTVSGSSRTNFFPVFSSQTNLAKSGMYINASTPEDEYSYVFSTLPGSTANGFFTELRSASDAGGGFFFAGSSVRYLSFDLGSFQALSSVVSLTALADSGDAVSLTASAGGDIALDTQGKVYFRNGWFDGSSASMLTIPGGVAPASNPCTPGQLYVSSGFLYVCDMNSSSWYRVALDEVIFP